MLKRSEGFIKGYHDTKIYYQKWDHPQARMLCVLTHGQAEHSDCYHRLIDAIAPLGISVIAWDMRGHGRSEGQRGYARDFSEYCHDYELLLNFVKNLSEQKNLPKFLLAHSMGGLVQLKTVLSSDQSAFQFQVLSSPMLGVAVKVPTYKEVAAQILYNLLPQVTMGNEILNEFLTRDQAVIVEYQKDVLRHNKISSGVYLGSLKAMEYVFNHINKLKLPTYIQMAEQDPVVSSDKIKQLYEHMDKSFHQLKIYPNRMHELYNDLDREEVFQDLRNYIQSKMK